MPAVVRRQSWAVRGAAGVLWLACMASTICGHAQFFLQSMQHAGAVRVAAVARPVISGRTAVEVAKDQAQAQTHLARDLSAVSKCEKTCARLKSDIANQRGLLAVYAAESKQAQANEAQMARYEARTDAALVDPVSQALVAIGLSETQATLAQGMGAALSLELVACLLWFVGIGQKAAIKADDPATEAVAVVAAPEICQIDREPEQVAMPEQVKNAEADERAANEFVARVTTGAQAIGALPFDERVQAMIDVARVEVAAGSLRLTVDAIRIRFECARDTARLVVKALKAEAVKAEA